MRNQCCNNNYSPFLPTIKGSLEGPFWEIVKNCANCAIFPPPYIEYVHTIKLRIKDIEAHLGQRNSRTEMKRKRNLDWARTKHLWYSIMCVSLCFNSTCEMKNGLLKNQCFYLKKLQLRAMIPIVNVTKFYNY